MATITLNVPDVSYKEIFVNLTKKYTVKELKNIEKKDTYLLSEIQAKEIKDDVYYEKQNGKGYKTNKDFMGKLFD